ncbi:MAG: 50S ribosomal protein L25 [Chloroflexota bacterium]
MAIVELRAQPRRVMRKKVRFLRREGTIPANVYGRGANSMPLQLDAVEVERLLAQHGSGGIISLRVEGEKHPRSAVLREVQRDALTGGLIHVDLQQVSMAEELKVEVPVVLVGEARLTKASAGVVIQTANTLMVKCLPRQIPERIEANIGELAEPGQAVHVRDLVLGEGVVVLADPEEVVVKVVAARIEEEKPAVVAEEVPTAEVAAEAAEAKPEEKAEE